MATVQELVQEISSKDESTAYGTIVGLREPDKSPEVIEAVIGALRHESPMVREGAAVALGRLRAVEAIGPLIAALADDYDDYEWRPAIQATNSLSKIGVPAVPALALALKDSNDAIRFCAVQALSSIDDDRVIELLLTALQDEDASVRWQAAALLGRVGDARALEPLRRMAREDKEIWGKRSLADAAAEAERSIRKRLFFQPWHTMVKTIQRLFRVSR